MKRVQTVRKVGPGQYASTVVQTISNPDGTVSIIHVDPNNPVITLPDGTTAQVIQEGTGVHTLAEVAAGSQDHLHSQVISTELDFCDQTLIAGNSDKRARTDLDNG